MRDLITSQYPPELDLGMLDLAFRRSGIASLVCSLASKSSMNYQYNWTSL